VENPLSKELAGKGTENIVTEFPFKSPIKVTRRDVKIQRLLDEKGNNIRKLTYICNIP